MTVSIRLATVDDALQIHEMICELARYEGEERSVKVTAADLGRQLNQVNPPFQCMIAEIDGQPGGFALHFYAYSTWAGARTLYLEDLYVRQQFRGAGVGAALMLCLARTARQNQCGRFEWSVLDWNRSAIDFYQRLGAEPVSGWTRYRLDADAIEALLRTSAPKEPAKSVA